VTLIWTSLTSLQDYAGAYLRLYNVLRDVGNAIVAADTDPAGSSIAELLDQFPVV